MRNLTPKESAAVEFRRGQLLTAIEGARTMVALARRSDDLLDREDRFRLTDVAELLAGIEQRAWARKP